MTYLPHQDMNKIRVAYFRKILAAYRGWRTWFNKKGGKTNPEEYPELRARQLLYAVSGLLDAEFSATLRQSWRWDGKLDILLAEAKEYIKNNRSHTEKACADDIPELMETLMLMRRCCRVILLNEYDHDMHFAQIQLEKDIIWLLDIELGTSKLNGRKAHL